jgi:ABC-type transport system involved in cytochrome bd biosynthesis fused ATPase/permease subunit
MSAITAMFNRNGQPVTEADLQTMLSASPHRAVDGQDAWSGGHVALARAFIRRAPIVILDEPTSAMDPWAEVEWLRRFRDLARGRTVIIITHRFTTASHADFIHVMDNGRISESGTHTKLQALGGRSPSTRIL